MPFPSFPPYFPQTDYLIYTPQHSIFHAHSINSDSHSSSSAKYENDTEYLLLFTPGNPGLIGYYRPFLQHLACLLGILDKRTRDFTSIAPIISILGISHAGFSVGLNNTSNLSTNPVTLSSTWTPTGGGNRDVNDDDSLGGNWTPWPPQGPYGLTPQVLQKVELMEYISRWFHRQQDRLGITKKRRGLKFILVAHSVGGWIALETVRELLEREGRRREEGGVGEERREKGNDEDGWDLVHEDGRGTDDGAVNVDIVGGIFLFPTIMHIAKSRSGRIATPILTRLPNIPTLTQILANLLTTLLPYPLLTSIISLVTSFTQSRTPDALSATIAFLKSPGGVRQALYMANEEMLRIMDDVWGEEVWGMPPEGQGKKEVGKLRMGKEWIMYFGKEDHWVADEVRDRLIQTRGRVRRRGGDGNGNETMLDDEEWWKPEMVICEDGLPHGFCIDHGEMMAEKVVKWVRKIIEDGEI